MGIKLKEDSELLWEYRRCRENGKLTEEHRMVMEHFLGRKLNKNEIVHHINENKLDNRLENLEIMTRSEHSKLHKAGKIMSDEFRNKMKKAIEKAKELGTIKGRPVDAYRRKGALYKHYDYIREISKDGHAIRHVVECCEGKRKTHHGLIWKYSEENSNKELNLSLT